MTMSDKPDERRGVPRATKSNVATLAATAPQPREFGIPAGFRNLLGWETTIWEAGYAEITMVVGPEHLNAMGLLHGGVYATLIDVAVGHAALWCSRAGHVRYAVTTSVNTTFLASARAGDVITAIGRLAGAQDRMATCTAEIVGRGGKLYALGQGDMLYMPGSEKLDGVEKTSPASARP